MSLLNAAERPIVNASVCGILRNLRKKFLPLPPFAPLIKKSPPHPLKKLTPLYPPNPIAPAARSETSFWNFMASTPTRSARLMRCRHSVLLESELHSRKSCPGFGGTWPNEMIGLGATQPRFFVKTAGLTNQLHPPKPLTSKSIGNGGWITTTRKTHGPQRGVRLQEK